MDNGFHTQYHTSALDNMDNYASCRNKKMLCYGQGCMVCSCILIVKISPNIIQLYWQGEKQIWGTAKKSRWKQVNQLQSKQLCRASQEFAWPSLMGLYVHIINTNRRSFPKLVSRKTAYMVQTSQRSSIANRKKIMAERLQAAHNHLHVNTGEERKAYQLRKNNCISMPTQSVTLKKQRMWYKPKIKW